MLKQRVITALILASLVIWGVLRLPDWGFALLLSVVVALAAWEWGALLGRGRSVALGYTGLILVHAALGAPFVVTTVLATLQSFNQNLVKASLSLGASPLETFFRVTLPVIAPGVISGALFAFATSFDEVIIAIFISGAIPTLPKKMYDNLRVDIDPTIAAVSTIEITFLILVTLLVVATYRRRATSQG